MKKIILRLGIAASFLLVTYTANAQAITQQNVTPQEKRDKIDLPAPPKFKSDDVNKSVNKLVALFKEYAPAIRSKDSLKVREFSEKVQEMGQNETSWWAEMSQEEQQQLKDYVQRLQEVILLVRTGKDEE